MPRVLSSVCVEFRWMCLGVRDAFRWTIGTCCGPVLCPPPGTDRATSNWDSKQNLEFVSDVPELFYLFIITLELLELFVLFIY